MKERRVRCAACGERFIVVRIERERTSAYCDLCRVERRREQTRARMQRWRDQRRAPLPPMGGAHRSEPSVPRSPHPHRGS